VGIAGDKAPSLGPFVDDSKAGSLGAASFAQAWVRMNHRAVVAAVDAWAFVAHTSCWDSSFIVIAAVACPYRVANICGRRRSKDKRMCREGSRLLFAYECQHNRTEGSCSTLRLCEEEVRNIG
jgi:hypothetical protein